jgi:hypothetical protein
VTTILFQNRFVSRLIGSGEWMTILVVDIRCRWKDQKSNEGEITLIPSSLRAVIGA